MRRKRIEGGKAHTIRTRRCKKNVNKMKTTGKQGEKKGKVRRK